MKTTLSFTFDYEGINCVLGRGTDDNVYLSIYEKGMINPRPICITGNTEVIKRLCLCIISNTEKFEKLER